MMQGKTVLITGASSGIGLATAAALAAKGAHILLAARDAAKLQEATSHIRSETSNALLTTYTADLSSQLSTRALAASIKKDHQVIDVLINNAGGVFPDFKLSVDGLEMTIATNHFSQFLLTNLLLDNIRRSDYARIVNVSSDSHYNGKIDFESFTKNKGYFIMKAYAQSKLANVLFTQELAERLAGTHVTANSLHPGFVKTNIGNKDTSWYASAVWSLITSIGAISVEKGAETSVYLASSPEVQSISGKYFTKCKEKQPGKQTFDKALQKELWRVSEQLCPL
ncbi:MAG: SDR family oxidoreductase [Bacteroidetes bacterium]|nr:SDR family oxidoreductase [Bacteroidota bacterium]